MTTTKTMDERNRDIQDHVERMMFKSLTYTDEAGAHIAVEGSGTSDFEVPVVNTGFGFNLDDDTPAEVLTINEGSDAGNKMALMTLPRNKQRKWAKRTGGIQNPLDPDKAVELNEKRTQVTEDNFAVSMTGVFEVKDGVVYIRGSLHVENDLFVGGDVIAGGNISTAGRFIGPDPSGSGSPPPAIPGFDA